MIHGSEQQILIKIRTTKSLRNLRIFCPLLGTVHYWGLLLNKNGWEAGFCPLLGAFPLLGSALLGEYSVFPCYSFCPVTVISIRFIAPTWAMFIFFSKTPLPTRKKLVRQQQFIEEQSFSVETAKRIYAFCAVDCMTHFCAISNPLQEELRCTIYCRFILSF